ncbi:MAG: aminotransferase class [Firmicutes bacterium]|nr:aminotransferase class [Bacillota bacterium]
MDKFDFDQMIDRHHTGAEKWDGLMSIFGCDDVLPMWVADMDFASPPAVVEALVSRARHGVYGYPLRAEGYYQAAMNWQKSRHGWTVEKPWINSVPGVVSAISLALQAFTHPGDKVLIQPPVYPGFYKAIRKNGRELVENPLRLEHGRYGIDFTDLENKLATGVKVMILCSPHNPVGRVWSKEELLRLGECCQRHGVLMIADEIHGDLVFRGHAHQPLATLSPEFAANTITFVSPSKTFNVAGLATALSIIPDAALRARYQTVLDAVHIEEGNIFGITALEAAYASGGDWLDSLLVYLEGNADMVVDTFKKTESPIKVLKPEATYLAWLDCRGLGLTPDKVPEFFTRLAKVGLSDGRRFGEQGNGFMRLNFACPRPVLKYGLERICSMLGL